MQEIKAADFGVLPGKDVTREVSALCAALADIPGEKTVRFAAGTYHLRSDLCEKHRLVITNTVGDKEFSPEETPHENAVPFYLENMEDLTLDFGAAVFVIDGKVTNFAAVGCRNLTVKNLEIRHSRPDMHELRVTRVTPISVDFEADRDTDLYFKGDTPYFRGRDYDYPVARNAATSGWIGHIRARTPDRLARVQHPLCAAVRTKRLGERRFRAYFPNTWRFKKGDLYYIFDVRRQFAGIFLDRCANVRLENIKQRFNYSLALVAQDCENLEADHLEFAPEATDARRMASVADFIQICMCRGDVSITNSVFDGAGDDCLNVHGIHFAVTEKAGDRLTLRFMHPQTHGFLPLRVGDTVAFISPKTLLETGRTSIEAVRLLNEYEIELTVSDAMGAEVGCVIEDVDACPNVVFASNTLNRIITRGLLLTTRGKVLVENNRFVSTTMSGILLSDDAKSWYESGMCCNVTVRGNTFAYCGQTPIRILPENAVHAGPVHKNIHIVRNRFERYKGFCITAKSTDNLQVTGNRFLCGKPLKTVRCTHVRLED